MVMVKPGLPYLDILRRVKDEFGADLRLPGQRRVRDAARRDRQRLAGRTCVMEALSHSSAPAPTAS